ncbi:hypothetical protein [Sphingobacterium sp. HMA12]|nr:hypothetical protein [Sphingobacterium sp. HMA12]
MNKIKWKELGIIPGSFHLMHDKGLQLNFNLKGWATKGKVAAVLY